MVQKNIFMIMVVLMLGSLPCSQNRMIPATCEESSNISEERAFSREQDTYLENHEDYLQSRSISCWREETCSRDSVTIAWVNHYSSNLLSGWDVAQAMTIDASDHVFVTGRSKISDKNYDYATVKYNPNGTLLWVARCNGPGNGYDNPYDITVDGAGNVYVTGESENSDTGRDYATVKYDPDGKEQWISRYNGPGNRTDVATKLTFDGYGNILVTGSSVGSNMNFDYATIKYNTAGDELWMSRYSGFENSEDWVNALAVDDSGNVYVTGGSEGPSANREYTTIKYTPEGVQERVVRYNGKEDADYNAKALSVDKYSNVYVTGESAGVGTGTDFATIKYSPDGIQEWVRRYNGWDNSFAGAIALATDRSGNICVTGKSETSDTGCDVVTVQYNSHGDQKWVARYNGPLNDDDIPGAIAVNGSGRLYVVGSSRGLNTGSDYIVVKYHPNGNQEWVARYQGPEETADKATALTIDGSGNIHVTGYSSTWLWTTYTTIKCVQPLVRGDVDGDGTINILDVVDVVNHILGVHL